MTNTGVKLWDLSVPDDPHRAALLAAVETVLRHGQVLVGPEVAELEARVAALVGRRHAVGVGSGTDALRFALQVAGVGPGDEVITTPLSWIATFNAIASVGAVPVAVDIREDLTLDPAALDSALSTRTRAILPVHFTGHLCSMDPIMAFARAHDLPVIEDAAQVLGAHDSRGRPGGSFGRLAAFSLNATKPFHCYGEGGVVVTDTDADLPFLRAARHNGTQDGVCHHVGGNSRLDTLQAAMLLVELERLPAILARRRAVAARYRDALSSVVTPCWGDDNGTHCFHTCTIRTPHRDALRAHLAAQGIETRLHHLPLMPDHPAHAARLAAWEAETGRTAPPLPRARALAEEIVSLPCHEKMTDDQVETVIQGVQSFFAA